MKKRCLYGNEIICEYKLLASHEWTYASDSNLSTGKQTSLINIKFHDVLMLKHTVEYKLSS